MDSLGSLPNEARLLVCFLISAGILTVALRSEEPRRVNATIAEQSGVTEHYPTRSEFLRKLKAIEKSFEEKRRDSWQGIFSILIESNGQAPFFSQMAALFFLPEEREVAEPWVRKWIAMDAENALPHYVLASILIRDSGPSFPTPRDLRDALEAGRRIGTCRLLCPTVEERKKFGEESGISDMDRWVFLGKSAARSHLRELARALANQMSNNGVSADFLTAMGLTVDVAETKDPSSGPLWFFTGHSMGHLLCDAYLSNTASPSSREQIRTRRFASEYDRVMTDVRETVAKSIRGKEETTDDGSAAPLVGEEARIVTEACEEMRKRIAELRSPVQAQTDN